MKPRYTFMITSRSVLLRMRKVSDKRCRENQNAHFTLRNFFFSKILPFMRECGKYGKSGQAIWHIRHACCIPKSININSEYVLLIALPLQQWLHERASMLESKTYIAYLVYITVDLPINFQLAPPPPPASPSSFSHSIQHTAKFLNIFPFVTLMKTNNDCQKMPKDGLSKGTSGYALKTKEEKLHLKFKKL